MKKALLLFAFLPVMQLQAQDFTGQHSGNLFFYKPAASATLRTVKCDSATLSGADSIYWMQPGLRDVMGDNIDMGCSFWGGPYCYMLRDVPTAAGLKTRARNRFIEYYNYLDNNISFDMNLSVGDSVLVFEDSLQRVRIKLVSAGPVTSFGNADSLLSFQLSHTDLADVPLSSALNGSAITFSKLYGMMNGYAMDSFPYVLEPLTLEGVRGPNAGFHGLSQADVYDYNTGDQYETHTFSAGGPPNNNYYRYTILTRTDFSDRVEYSVRVDKQELYTIGPPPYAYVYSSDTVTQTYYKNVWIEETLVWGMRLSERYYLPDSLLGCPFSGYAYEAFINQCYTECPGTTCIGGADCFMLSKYEYRLAKKAGLVHYYVEGISTPWNNFSNDLIYLDGSGGSCGHATLGLSENESLGQTVKLFPNPARDQVSLETAGTGHDIVKVTVTDLTGKQLTVAVNRQASRATLSVSALPQGTYWLYIETTGGATVKKLAVLH